MTHVPRIKLAIHNHCISDEEFYPFFHLLVTNHPLNPTQNSLSLNLLFTVADQHL